MEQYLGRDFDAFLKDSRASDRRVQKEAAPISASASKPVMSLPLWRRWRGKDEADLH